jgi:hypothetical protein
VATIGPVQLKITLKGNDANVVVTYQISWDSYDKAANQPYVEVCQLIGDDTATGDPPAPDHALGFLTPIGAAHVQASGKTTLKREWKKTFRKSDLDEDRGSMPNPDEIRATVTLTPVLPAAAKAESNLVTKKI